MPILYGSPCSSWVSHAVLIQLPLLPAPMPPPLIEDPSLPPLPPPLGPTTGSFDTSIFPPIVSPGGGLILSPTLLLPRLGIDDPKSLSIGPPLSMLSCPEIRPKVQFLTQISP